MNSSRFIKNHNPNTQVVWLTKKVFKDFLDSEESIDRVVTIEDDFDGKILPIKNYIKKEGFDLIYDAHRNLRTLILKLSFLFSFYKINWIYRPKSRVKRFLFFSFGINLFPKPFYARKSYLMPLKDSFEYGHSNGKFSVNFDRIDLNKFKFINDEFILMAPSAAWEMKRWPTQKWGRLIEDVSRNRKVILVGGSGDTFISSLYDNNNENVINMAGLTTLYETFYLIDKSKYVLSADTGVIHVAELLGKRGGLLLGPTAFGRTESEFIKVFESDLPCRPCSKDGRGNCKRSIYQECMENISYKEVRDDIISFISPL